MHILETERLTLRQLGENDAVFIREMMNEPAWLRFIGDRDIRTVETARNYILEGPVKMYERTGFGLWLVELKQGGIPIGICGLIKRDSLEDVDLGFAFRAAHWRKGFAYEAASATMSYGKERLGLRRIVAIMSPDNEASGRLLEKLGFRFERMVRVPSQAPEIKLYAATL